MKTFTKLAQANVDLFNSHPKLHTTITVVYGIGTVVAINKLAKRVAGVKND